jgi:predicted  nucleic acid-binding Zn-ribbon protein
MKTAIITVVACIVGATAGVLLTATRIQPQLEAARLEAAQLKDKATKAEAEVPDLKFRIEHLESENTTLKSQVADLEAFKVTSLNAPKPQMTEDDALAALEAEVPDETPAEGGNRNGDRRNRRQGGFDPANLTPEQRAEFEERREAMRTRVADMMNQEIAKYNDPAVTERITAIDQQRQAMTDMWQAMRDAKTDEERDALRDQMSQARDQMASLMVEQQDYMLRDLAKQYGITDPAKQEQFLQAMRETTSSPLYRASMGFGAGGGRGDFGGFGGGGDGNRGGGGSRGGGVGGGRGGN